MLALATCIKIRAEIDQKSHVFWDLDFDRILEGFWEAKILNFRTFFDVFSMSFFKRGSEGQKIKKKCEKTHTFPLFGLGFAVVPPLLGKEKDRGKNTTGRVARKNVEIGQL